jgi:hypothetical protein
MDRHAGSNKEEKNKKLSHNPIIAKMAFFGNMSRDGFANDSVNTSKSVFDEREPVEGWKRGQG